MMGLQSAYSVRLAVVTASRAFRTPPKRKKGVDYPSLMSKHNETKEKMMVQILARFMEWSSS